MEKNNYFRNVAIKTIIRDLLEGTYIQENDQETNYLLTYKQQKIFRGNIMATVLAKEKIGSITNLTVDDGSGKIIVRSFEANKFIDQTNIGDVVLIIGIIRTYNQEKYISPEIVKKIEPAWLKMRSLEMAINLQNQIIDLSEKMEEISEEIEEKSIEEKEIESLPFQKIINLIKELDQGEGVLIEEIIEKSSLNEPESLIKTMLEKGEIYQIKPGTVKVL